ncbi:hypothetical protein [Streptomyces sp. I05A-00742]|uniref:hypothetical protein n=1 Tax=Streptomyces sp. I05A-00742 TaxID=2732853 RepID=UPI0014891854|nr:hypothetical protein [Streptomyces sp. I05A-00742]
MRRILAAAIGAAATVALLATPVPASGVPGLTSLGTHARPADGRAACLLDVLDLICVL